MNIYTQSFSYEFEGASHDDDAAEYMALQIIAMEIGLA